MGLVGYSESEGSTDDDVNPLSESHVKAGKNPKSKFQKVIDRSNPHKILVNLPETTNKDLSDKPGVGEPPTKRVRLGGGGGPGGFNALLPAPKKAVPSGSMINTTRGGLGSGVSLKTGAAPGFSRDPVPKPEQEQEEQSTKDAVATSVSINGEDGVFPSQVEGKIMALNSGIRTQGNPMMFKPLSVARKVQKKKLNPSNPNQLVPQAAQETENKLQLKAPKVSLFSMHAAESREAASLEEGGDYQPMVYQAMASTEDGAPTDGLGGTGAPQGSDAPAALESSQSLDAIAADLNLSASARRQLLGRKAQNSSAINVMNFNTDAEYASNEVLRQSGEQQTHNPVRAITAGKHSLKQLVNAVSSQKEALEEQFASGRRNKKEAGSKYGW